MSHDPIVLAIQVEQRIDHAATEVERPAPSVEQQHVADAVFSRDESQAVAAILGVQMGLTLVQHLVAEARPPANEEEVLRRKKAEPLEE